MRSRGRSLNLSDETVALRREHKRVQSEVNMKNRMHYVDQGLMFAQAWEEPSSKRSVLGAPLNKMKIGTCATLLLSTGVPADVVQQRLGHLHVEI